MASGFPVIFIGSGEKGPSIIANNRRGILDALQHLKGHGHQRIAFIAGSVEDMEGDSGDRLGAYRAALHTFDLVDDPSLRQRLGAAARRGRRLFAPDEAG